jgi:hypothetical protein
MRVNYHSTNRPYGNGHFVVEGCEVVKSEGFGCFTLRAPDGSTITRVNGVDCAPRIRTCDRCGSIHLADRSCGCFDNGSN